MTLPQWLQNFQFKESFEVPESILEHVMNELYKQRITDLSSIDNRKIREVLKQLKLRKTYEHTSQICARITGIPAPKLTASQEEMYRHPNELVPFRHPSAYN